MSDLSVNPGALKQIPDIPVPVSWDATARGKYRPAPLPRGLPRPATKGDF